MPTPVGHEGVRSIDDVVAAVTDVRAGATGCSGCGLKLDDSGAGDGNIVMGLRAANGAAADLAEIRRRVEALPDWYVTDLAGGGVVEELEQRSPLFRSPSAQVELSLQTARSLS